MYIGHARLCVFLSVCLSVCPSPHSTLLHWPGCNLGNGRGCPLVVHYWADLQLVHGFCCYDNRAPNAKCQRVLVLAQCLVVILTTSIQVILEWIVHLDVLGWFRLTFLICQTVYNNGRLSNWKFITWSSILALYLVSFVCMHGVIS